MVRRNVKEYLASLLAEAAGKPGPRRLTFLSAALTVEIVPVIIEHVQDGAEFRMLSGDRCDGFNVPRRSRTSKAQVRVVRIRAGGRQWEPPC